MQVWENICFCQQQFSCIHICWNELTIENVKAYSPNDLCHYYSPLWCFWRCQENSLSPFTFIVFFPRTKKVNVSQAIITHILTKVTKVMFCTRLSKWWKLFVIPGGAISVPFVIFQTRFIMFPGGPHLFFFKWKRFIMYALRVMLQYSEIVLQS